MFRQTRGLSPRNRGNERTNHHHHHHNGDGGAGSGVVSVPAMPRRTDSPFESVRSDLTLDEEGPSFEEFDDASQGNSNHFPTTNATATAAAATAGIQEIDEDAYLSSTLEYSDDSPRSSVKERRPRRLPSSKFRERDVSSPPNTSTKKATATDTGGAVHNHATQDYGTTKPTTTEAIRSPGPSRHRRGSPISSPPGRSVTSSAHSPSSPSHHNWMKKWAHSFRSPVVHPLTNTSRTTDPDHRHGKESASSGHRRRSKDTATPTSSPEPRNTHRRHNSGDMEEYPHFNSQRRSDNLAETSPLLSSTSTTSHAKTAPLSSSPRFYPSPPRYYDTAYSTPTSHAGSSSLASHGLWRTTDRGAVVAASFLQDYEANRPPTFSSALDITDHQITLYHWNHSIPSHVARIAATLAVFGSSFLEAFSDNTLTYSHRTVLTGLNLGASVVFGWDVLIRHRLRGPSSSFEDARARSNHGLAQPLILFCVVLGLETVARWMLWDQDDTDLADDRGHIGSNGGSGDGIVLFASLFKPLVLFYVSSQARDALAAVRRILKIVLRVLIMELLLIFMFAAVACRLFSDYDAFATLSVSWLSLFELATTVVNPGLWMPVYQDHPMSALFFVFFTMVTVFYVHSLVLSVVFQTYIQAAAEIHERYAADREDAVQLAFTALLQQQHVQQEHVEMKDHEQPQDSSDVVEMEVVRQTLQLIRPHYNAMKINALVEIVDPSSQGSVDYATFRTKIRQALNASIRTARTASSLSMTIELIAVAVAVINSVYVVLVSSTFHAVWFEMAQETVGCVITLFAAFELLVRFNPLQVPHLAPMTRLNAIFDGSALVAALVSCIGIVLYATDQPRAVEYILVGRAIDMIRTMRFFQIFRDVVRRTSDVVPALGGPLILVVTTLHIFVYLGMGLWGGAVEIGQHQGEIEDLYDLNNFNSYHEGAVTMFQVLVVNDWHAIAQVFTYATRCSSCFIVYPFFICANLVGVSIMLNVLTAFFVGSFVTKLNDDKNAPAESHAKIHNKERDFTIQSSERPGKRISANNSGRKNPRDASFDRSNDADSETSSQSEMYEFDVYEREGFDKIMQTVAGAQYEVDVARQICNYLEIFESLSPGRETVGYLVCDQQTLERFGNRRFKTKSIGFLDDTGLHEVVTDMHAELLALAFRTNFQERSLIRTFPHRREPGKTLEISASLLRRNPALSLFVSRTTSAQVPSNVAPQRSEGRKR